MKSIIRYQRWATVLGATMICSTVIAYTSANAQEDPGCFMRDSSGQIVDASRSCPSDSNSQDSQLMDAQAFFQSGRQLSSENKIQEAIVEFSRAIELNPDYLEACYYRSGALVEVNQPLKAIVDVEKVAALFSARGESDKAQVMLKFADGIRAGIKTGEFNQ